MKPIKIQVRQENTHRYISTITRIPFRVDGKRHVMYRGGMYELTVSRSGGKAGASNGPCITVL